MNKINNWFESARPYAPTILRLGFTFVFIWFGTNQLMHPEMWTRLIPEWVTGISGISAINFVYINGSFEIIAAILLLLNVWTRWVAFILFLHLATIVFDVGFNAIGVRDIGLAIGCLVLSLVATKDWSK